MRTIKTWLLFVGQQIVFLIHVLLLAQSGNDPWVLLDVVPRELCIYHAPERLKE